MTLSMSFPAHGSQSPVASCNWWTNPLLCFCHSRLWVPVTSTVAATSTVALLLSWWLPSLFKTTYIPMHSALLFSLRLTFATKDEQRWVSVSERKIYPDPLVLPALWSGAAAGKCVYSYFWKFCCWLRVRADYIKQRPRALPRGQEELLKLLWRHMVEFDEILIADFNHQVCHCTTVALAVLSHL